MATLVPALVLTCDRDSEFVTKVGAALAKVPQIKLIEQGVSNLGVA
ncbi:hypothetical protein NDA01_19705 [Trichocoleus desertorum AS-A10]